MKVVKKLTILSVLLGVNILLSVLPCYAKINGGVFQNYFFDEEKTIMTETPFNKTLTTGKYWENNVFYFNKYRPLFMLSNKELYNLMPKEKVSVAQRISTPTVYNVSFKTASIKNISFENASLSEPIKEFSMTQKPVVKDVKRKNYGSNTYALYEKAKDSNMDSEQKIDIAMILKNSKEQNNYLLAIDLLDDVTDSEPFNAYAFYLKGEIYSAQKNSADAMKNYVQSLKINPSSKQCCLSIAKVLEPTNKELAMKYYQKAK